MQLKLSVFCVKRLGTWRKFVEAREDSREVVLVLVIILVGVLILVPRGAGLEIVRMDRVAS